MQDQKANPSGNPGHSGTQTKGTPVNKSGASKSVSAGKPISSGKRIVTPTRGGKLKDGATSRIKGNRMKSRGFSKKAR